MEFDLNKRHCYYFYKTTQIPHGSFNEKALSDYIVEFAKEHGLRYVQDEVWNVIIYKDGTQGLENSAPLILQAHMDMVCEKNKDSDHDFKKDPLDLYVEDGILRARGTTLGADDCTGVAYMLSILEDKSLKHPPLECIFTTMEEVGLIGAMKLDPSLIHSHRMISLDGGGEISTPISTAGGCRCDISKELTWEENSDPCYSLAIRGLLGGHSGGEIHKEKGNANQLAIRILKEMMLSGVEAQLVSYSGGLKENAIPREADIIFSSPTSKEELEKALQVAQAAIKVELEFSDNGFHVLFDACDMAKKKVCKCVSDDIIDYAYLMPNGFQHRSMAIEGLTLTSLNLGVVEWCEEKVIFHVSIRSAIESGIDNLVKILSVLASRLQFTVTTSSRYPAWNYNPVSAMRDTYAKVIREMFDKEIVLTAAHGGTECGVFVGFVNDMDIISVGPNSKYIHTPDEELDLESFDRTYEILCNIIAHCE
ncbi:MAG: beta-Ala-His dipeptidase [Erysipelotrichales bacterium]|nr:beta-Ala-His dipeptidase [Erysipelotrichales bacterium]